jgi:hypothetical protein
MSRPDPRSYLCIFNETTCEQTTFTPSNEKWRLLAFAVARENRLSYQASANKRHLVLGSKTLLQSENFQHGTYHWPWGSLKGVREISGIDNEIRSTPKTAINGNTSRKNKSEATVH